MITIQIMYQDTGRIVEVPARKPTADDGAFAMFFDLIPSENPEGYTFWSHSGHSDVGTVSPTGLYFAPVARP